MTRALAARKRTSTWQRRFSLMNKRPLGRGLSALISTGPPSAANDEIREIEIDLIRPGQQQPRTSFDQAKLDELAQSIRTTGIIQPLLVRPVGGVFELGADKRLIDTLGLTQDEVAKRVGRDRSFITNYLRVLKLPTEIQRMIENEKLS